MILLLTLANALPENCHFIALTASLSYQSMLRDSFYKTVLFAAAEKFLTVSHPVAWVIAVADYALGIVTCVIAKKIPVVNRLMGLR